MVQAFAQPNQLLEKTVQLKYVLDVFVALHQ